MSKAETRIAIGAIFVAATAQVLAVVFIPPGTVLVLLGISLLNVIGIICALSMR